MLGVDTSGQGAEDRRPVGHQQQHGDHQADHPCGDQAVVAFHAHVMLGMGRGRARVVQLGWHGVIPAVPRIVMHVVRRGSLRLYGHGLYRRRRRMCKRPAEHRRHHYQQHGQACPSVEPAVEKRRVHRPILSRTVCASGRKRLWMEGLRPFVACEGLDAPHPDRPPRTVAGPVAGLPGNPAAGRRCLSDSASIGKESSEPQDQHRPSKIRGAGRGKEAEECRVSPQ